MKAEEDSLGHTDFLIYLLLIQTYTVTGFPHSTEEWDNSRVVFMCSFFFHEIDYKYIKGKFTFAQRVIINHLNSITEDLRNI